MDLTALSPYSQFVLRFTQYTPTDNYLYIYHHFAWPSIDIGWEVRAKQQTKHNNHNWLLPIFAGIPSNPE